MRELRYDRVMTHPLTKEELHEKGTLLTLQHMLYNAATSTAVQENLDIKTKMRMHSMSSKIVEKRKLKAADLIFLRERAALCMNILPFGFVSDEIAYTLEEEPEADDSAS